VLHALHHLEVPGVLPLEPGGVGGHHLDCVRSVGELTTPVAQPVRRHVVREGRYRLAVYEELDVALGEVGFRVADLGSYERAAVADLGASDWLNGVDRGSSIRLVALIVVGFRLTTGVVGRAGAEVDLTVAVVVYSVRALGW
jgi:hypothetical protein